MAQGYCDDVSVLLQGLRKFFAGLRDRLKFLGKLPEQFSSFLLGVDLGGPRGSPGSLRSGVGSLLDLHSVKSDAQRAARGGFLTL